VIHLKWFDVSKLPTVEDRNKSELLVILADDVCEVIESLLALFIELVVGAGARAGV